ncbi:hypothetical protein E2K80_15125 [Rhodophyticola sp. CCM32]|uniref:Abi family protein n=1 Tax=Rhodophyticola sp. CCM32 TaxID=2916397 RepID=UPI00107EFF7F|nr:Abi family protein [Rhodophyticola sp. CCM32]QBY01894.1 hypothetical protein E2K80_15125 [Rhodophyticola sp. CCM32]
MPFTPDEIHVLPDIFSAPRFATYLGEKNGHRVDALDLYKWNLDVSCAFFAPLQVCEVSIRNAISEAIALTYGANWPYEQSFEIALPNPRRSYSPRANLLQHRNQPTAGKIIAELKFVFWERMFTSRHDSTMWNRHLRTVLPNMEAGQTVQELRSEAYTTLRAIRDLRNRIAHHEPIFRRDIQVEYDRIRKAVGWRSTVAADWLDKVETVTSQVANKP